MNYLKNFTGITILLIFTLACSEPTLDSSWKNSEISVDGSKADWKGALKYFEDEKVAIGIQNDDDYIYFCLATSDNSKIMKIFLTGFTVWLDPVNSDGETIGIQFPIKNGMGQVEHRQREKTEGYNNDQRTKMMIEKIKIEQNELLVVNEDKFPLNAYPIYNENGLEARISYEMHQLVYELKVPLTNENLSNVSIDVLPNELLKIGFESGEVEGKKDSNGSEMKQGGGTPGSGRGGRSGVGGGRGGMSGGGRGNKSNMKDTMIPIEFWMEVKLADKTI